MLEFIIAWFSTRPWYRLLLGVPAILMAALVLLGVLSRPFYTPQEIGWRYRRALADAANRKDVDTMFLAYRKLLQLDAADEKLVFQMSELMAQAGEWEQALAGMQRIAPLDRPGFALAHLWLIKAIIAGRLGLPEKEAIEQIDRHYQHLARLEPDNPAVRVEHAVFLGRTGQFDRALRILEPLVEQQPTVRMVIAAVKAAQDGMAAGKDYLRQAVAELEPRTLATDKDTQLSPAEFATLVEAHRVLGEWDAAESVMRQACQRYPDDQLLQRLMSAFLVQLAKHRRGEKPEEAGSALELLSQAMDADIRNQSPWLEMIRLSRESGELGQQASARLEQMVAREDAPSGARLLVGSEKAAQGKYEAALADLERVVEQNSNDAVAWNNLAWVLSAIGEDLPRAKQCSDKAVELAPQDLRFLETRGQVHAKLKMWRECIADLEAALPGFRDEPSVKQTLATAYRAVGEQEKAAALEKSVP